MLIRLKYLSISIFALLFTLSSVAEVPLETGFQMKAEVKDMRMAMERLHFSKKQVDSNELEQLIVNYMERLDFNHLYFLKSDELLWRQRFGKTLKRTYLDKNELYPAFYIFNSFESRVAARMQWTREFLEKEIDLFAPDLYVMSDDDTTWAKTKSKSNKLWELRLKNEILNGIIPDIRESIDEHFEETEVPELTTDLLDSVIGEEKRNELISDAKTKILERYERWTKRINETKQTEVQEDFLTELAQLYDPHSNFMSPDTSEEFSIAISNELIGIGAVLSDENGYCKIQELVDNGPAAKSGEIGAGDTIVGVAQGLKDFEDIVGKRLRDIVRLIRGKEDSLVRLKILPANGPDDEIIVQIIRKRIKLEEKLASADLFFVPSEERMIPIGVITLPNFYGPTAGNPLSTRASKDIDTLITKLKSQNIEGIILDLRNNGGGLLEEAINITGLFISSGPVVKVRNRSGKVEINRDYDPRIAWDGPLAILTSRYSASASEIVAGALQYYKRALIIGNESTHGKGTVQTTFALPISVYDLYSGQDNRFVRPNFLERVGRLIPMKTNRNGVPSMAKITIAKYYLPDGSSTQLKGVLSDISLPSVSDYLPIRESDLDNPLSWDNIEGNPVDSEDLVSNSYPYLQSTLIDVLNSRSRNRRKSLEEFHYLTESIANFKERYDRETLPLNLLDRMNLIYSDKHKGDEIESFAKKLGNFAFESIEIPLNDKAETTEEDSPQETLIKEEPVVTTTKLDTPETEGDQVAIEETTDEEEIEDKKKPNIDIHLRETMRIVGDWIQLEQFIDSGGNDPRQIAIHTLQEEFRKTDFLGDYMDGSCKISTH